MVLYLSYYRNITFALVASSIGVAMQLGITAAIDNKNGGAAASSAMQSGSGNQTIAEYNASNGGSLLFGGNINTTHNTNIDSAASIQSQNINQASQTNESASYESKHETIGPDWNQLMTDAAINGVVGGVTVAAGPLISAGVGKLANFATTTLNNAGLSSVVNVLKTAGNLIDDVVTKIDDVAGSLSNSTGFNKVMEFGDDIAKSVTDKIDDTLGTGVKNVDNATTNALANADDVAKNADKTSYKITKNIDPDQLTKSDIDKLTKVQKMDTMDNLANKIAENDGILTKHDIMIRDEIYLKTDLTPEYRAYQQKMNDIFINKIDNNPAIQNGLENWDSLSVAQKENLLNDIQKIQLDTYGIKKEYGLYFEDELGDSLGMYSNEVGATKVGKIELNSNFLNNRDEILDTLIHETTHMINDYMTMNPNKFPKSIQNQIKIFDKANGLGNMSPDTNYAAYLANPTERDAWNIGGKFKEYVQNIPENHRFVAQESYIKPAQNIDRYTNFIDIQDSGYTNLSDLSATNIENNEFINLPR